MVTDSELEGFRRDRYLARSWALLTQQRGWIKPVLVMTVALFVPVAGLLGMIGYAAEWARLTAWGVNAAPKQRDVRVGECISSGWRAFVVMLVWGLCWGVIGALVDALPLFGDLLDLVWGILNLFFYVVTLVAVLRATIYRRIAPGLRVGTIWQMVRHDPAGLLRIFGMQVAGYAITTVIAGLITTLAFAGIIPELIYLVDYLEYGVLQTSVVLEFMARVISSMGPALVILVLVSGFFAVIIELLLFTAVGLWLRQFDVEHWGRDEDPLPPFLDDVRSSGPAPDPVTPPSPSSDEPYTAQDSAPAAGSAPVSAPAPAPDPAPVSAPAPAPARGPILMPPAAPEVVAAVEAAHAEKDLPRDPGADGCDGDIESDPEPEDVASPFDAPDPEGPSSGDQTQDAAR